MSGKANLALLAPHQAVLDRDREAGQALMANGRNPKKRGHDSSRDAGGFVALPWAVLDSPAYLGLSHPAKALLLEVARQFVRNNNGQLLCSRAFMAGRGWKSHDVLHRAKRELLAAGLLFETVMGQRPNKAGWYALTWRALDKHTGYDIGAAASFKRGAYRASENAPLSPSGGTVALAIGPGDGTGTPRTVPGDGPIRGLFDGQSVPGDGHHLENHLPYGRQGERERRAA